MKQSVTSSKFSYMFKSDGSSPSDIKLRSIQTLNTVSEPSSRRASGNENCIEYLQNLSEQTVGRDRNVLALRTIFFAKDDCFSQWREEPGNGSIKKAVDKNLGATVLHITGEPYGNVFISRPRKRSQFMNINLPILALAVKEMNRSYASVEFVILDDTFTVRRFHAKNFISVVRLKLSTCDIPMRLDRGWSFAATDLESLCNQSYGTSFLRFLKIKINANIKLRRVFLASRAFIYDELPAEYRLTDKPHNQAKVEEITKVIWMEKILGEYVQEKYRIRKPHLGITESPSVRSIRHHFPKKSTLKGTLDNETVDKRFIRKLRTLRRKSLRTTAPIEAFMRLEAEQGWDFSQQVFSTKASEPSFNKPAMSYLKVPALDSSEKASRASYYHVHKINELEGFTNKDTSARYFGAARASLKGIRGAMSFVALCPTQQKLDNFIDGVMSTVAIKTSDVDEVCIDKKDSTNAHGFQQYIGISDTPLVQCNLDIAGSLMRKPVKDEGPEEEELVETEINRNFSEAAFNKSLCSNVFRRDTKAQVLPPDEEEEIRKFYQIILPHIDEYQHLIEREESEVAEVEQEEESGMWSDQEIEKLLEYSNQLIKDKNICIFDRNACLEEFYWNENYTTFSKLRKLYSAQGVKGLYGYKPKIPEGFTLKKDEGLPAKTVKFPKRAPSRLSSFAGVKNSFNPEGSEQGPFYRYQDQN